jgi:hypothetical protein
VSAEGEAAPEVVDLPPPEARRGTLKGLGGSSDDVFNNILANQVIQGLWLANSDRGERGQQLQAALSALLGVRPRDELEGMLGGQMVAIHSAAMECLRRAMLEKQSSEGRRENLGQANRLVRSYAALLEALDKHRGKGQQVVRVEHVHAHSHSGGRAALGPVDRPWGGGGREGEERARAKQLAYGPGPAMRRPDPEREPVPLAGDEG